MKLSKTLSENITNSLSSRYLELKVERQNYQIDQSAYVAESSQHEAFRYKSKQHDKAYIICN